MNPKTRKNISTLLIWGLMGALILYMISGGFTTRAPKEITVQEFVKLEEENKVQAVHETLGSGLYSGLYADSAYTTKDLPTRADFTFSCSEEEFSKNMSLLIARLQNKIISHGINIINSLRNYFNIHRAYMLLKTAL